MQQSIATLSVKIVLPMIALALLLPDVRADARAGEKVAQFCILCHAGRADPPFYPVLAGQTRAYFIAQIQAFKDKRRTQVNMNLNVMSLTKDEVSDLADYFSAQKTVAYTVFDASRVEAGRQALDRLTCQRCHGVGYKGDGIAGRLASQSPRYTAFQLRAIRWGTRFHPAGASETEIKSLPDETIDAIANALASLD